MYKDYLPENSYQLIYFESELDSSSELRMHHETSSRSTAQLYINNIIYLSPFF